MFPFSQGSPRSDLQTPVPSTVISTSSSAATTPETERKPLAPLPPVVNVRKDSQLRRPIPVRPPSVDNIPYQNNHSAVGKFILLRDTLKRDLNDQLNDNCPALQSVRKYLLY